MNKDILDMIYQIAADEIGVNEASNPDRIKEYEASTTLPDESIDAVKTPWCAAFVTWVLSQADLKSTNSAWAKSYLNWGLEIDNPVRGCVAILQRGVANGHAAFFVRFSDDKKSVFLLGGNQSNSVCVQTYPADKVLGYRVPKEAYGIHEDK